MFREQQGFQIVQAREGKPPVRVRVMEDPQPADLDGDGPERIVLCKSEPRGEKEHAIVSNAERRFLEALGKLAARVENKRLKARPKIEQMIGRIQARHPRARKFYTITLEDDAAGLRVRWTRDDELLAQAADLRGCNVLRTHCYTTILLPTRNGPTHRIRKAGQPEECQKTLYRNPGIDWVGLPCHRSVIGAAPVQNENHARSTTL